MIETYEEYRRKRIELKEAVLKQIPETDQKSREYIKSIEPLTEEEWEKVQEITYGPAYTMHSKNRLV